MSLLGASMGAKAAASGVAVSDNFNRADGGLGANWTTVTGLLAPTISTNQISKVGLGASGARWSADPFSENQYSEALVVGTSSDPGGSGNVVTVSGVACRMDTGSANTFYGAEIRVTDAWLEGSPDGTTSEYVLFKMVGGVKTELGTASAGSATSCFARLECSGTAITFYTVASHGGAKTQRVQATDLAIASGSAGVYIGANDPTSDAYVENWYGGDL